MDPGLLTARYGAPVSVEPDTARVEAALAPLDAERRATNLLLRGAAALVVGILIFAVARTSCTRGGMARLR